MIRSLLLLLAQFTRRDVIRSALDLEDRLVFRTGPPGMLEAPAEDHDTHDEGEHDEEGHEEEEEGADEKPAKPTDKKKEGEKRETKGKTKEKGKKPENKEKHHEEEVLDVAMWATLSDSVRRALNWLAKYGLVIALPPLGAAVLAVDWTLRHIPGINMLYGIPRGIAADTVNKINALLARGITAPVGLPIDIAEDAIEVFSGKRRLEEKGVFFRTFEFLRESAFEVPRLAFRGAKTLLGAGVEVVRFSWNTITAPLQALVGAWTGAFKKHPFWTTFATLAGGGAISQYGFAAGAQQVYGLLEKLVNGVGALFDGFGKWMARPGWFFGGVFNDLDPHSIADSLLNLLS